MALPIALRVLTSAGAFFWKRSVVAPHAAATETFVAFELKNLISRAYEIAGRKGQWPPDLPTLLKVAQDLTITGPNPNTGNSLPYEYVRPTEYRSYGNPEIAFYQLRESACAFDLHAAYYDGAVARPLKDEEQQRPCRLFSTRVLTGKVHDLRILSRQPSFDSIETLQKPARINFP